MGGFAVLVIVGFVLVLTANYLVKKISPDDAMF